MITEAKRRLLIEHGWRLRSGDRYWLPPDGSGQPHTFAAAWRAFREAQDEREQRESQE
jgi:hypothetical protein